MIRIYSTKRWTLKIGPIMAVVCTALAAAIWYFDFEGFFFLIALILFVVTAFIGTISTLAVLPLPSVLFEFDKNGVRYHKDFDRVIAWPQVRSMFYAEGGKGSFKVFLDVPSLPFKRKVLQFVYDFDRTGPAFKDFDEFRVALERLYGAPVVDATNDLQGDPWFLISSILILAPVLLLAVLTGWAALAPITLLAVGSLFPLIDARRDRARLKRFVQSRQNQPPGTV